MILLFFFVVFVSGGTRAFLEYSIKPRDMVLFNFSLRLSGFAFVAFLSCFGLFSLESQYHLQNLSFLFFIVLVVFLLAVLFLSIIMVIQKSRG